MCNELDLGKCRYHFLLKRHAHLFIHTDILRTRNCDTEHKRENEHHHITFINTIIDTIFNHHLHFHVWNNWSYDYRRLIEVIILLPAIDPRML